MGKTRRNAAKIVSAAIIGLDGERLAQAAFYLSDMEEAETLRGLLMSVGNPEPLCNALSCLIRGDESLRDDLMEGTMDEVAEAMEVAYSLASVENFWKLSALARNVASLTARQRL